VPGAGEARNRSRLAVERTVPFALLAHTLIVVWYARSGYDPADIDARRAEQPWYGEKTEPAFEDMLVKLRRPDFPPPSQASPPTTKSVPSPQPGPQQRRDHENLRKSRDVHLRESWPVTFNLAIRIVVRSIPVDRL